MFVQCKQCMATAFAGPDQDPHTVLRCTCCSQQDQPGHHHGRAANQCAEDPNHQCWAGPLSGTKPDECRVCRPILFLPNAEVTPAGLIIPTGLGGPN
jgi:hypothetical protein